MADIRLQNITKSFGTTAVVRDLSVEIADRELFVLVGPSGSGKTTALRILAGLESADSGSVSIGGRDVTTLAPAARNVGMVFQSYALFPQLNVEQNIAFGLRARKRPEPEVRELVLRAAGTLQIERLLDRLPRQLSGGERQRVALARALVREPDALLMDEPLSNLDAQLRAQTRTEIVRLQASVGTTTVYVTHDQIEALSMGHRIGVLREGALEQVGSPQEIYDAPATLFVARFIGSPPMNIVEADCADGMISAGPMRLTSVRTSTRGRALLGIRPEHVHVAGSRWSSHSAPVDAFRIPVAAFESVGDQAFVTVEADGCRLVARVEPSFRPAIGDPLKVWIDAGRVRLYDPATERALA